MNSEKKQQRHEKFANMTWKQKLGYFWTYYKFHVLAVIIVAVLGIFLIKDVIAGNRETSFYVTLVNASDQVDYNQFGQEFADYAGINTEDADIIMDTSLWTSSNDLSAHTDLTVLPKMMAMVSSESMDVTLAGESLMSYFADAGYFCDLRTVLPESYLADYEEYLYYYTYDEEAKKLDAEDRGVSYESSTKGPFDTTEPVPIGIKAAAFTNLPEGLDSDSVLGISITAPHADTILKFLDYLQH